MVEGSYANGGTGGDRSANPFGFDSFGRQVAGAPQRQRPPLHHTGQQQRPPVSPALLPQNMLSYGCLELTVVDLHCVRLILLCCLWLPLLLLECGKTFTTENMCQSAHMQHLLR